MVAVLWQAMLATAFKVHLPLPCYLVLGMGVWLIYMADRTVDAFAQPDASRMTVRHAFYRRNRHLFLWFVLPATGIMVALLALTAIPAGVMWRGVALGFLVALYLLHYGASRLRWFYIVGNAIACTAGAYVLWHLPIPLYYKTTYGLILCLLVVVSLLDQRRTSRGFRLVPKELVCGYFFAVGSSLCVNFYTLDQNAGPLSPLTLLFAVLCCLNCVGIACYEKELDAANDPNAITHSWPAISKLYPVLLSLLAVLILYFVKQLLTVELVACTLAILGSTVLLGIVHRMAGKLSSEMAHVLADVALVLPMLPVLLVG